MSQQATSMAKKRVWWLTEEDGRIHVYVAEGQGTSKKVSKLLNKKTEEAFGHVKECRAVGDKFIKFLFHKKDGRPDAYLLERTKFEYNRSDFSRQLKENASNQEFVKMFSDICSSMAIASCSNTSGSSNEQLSLSSSSDDGDSSVSCQAESVHISLLEMTKKKKEQEKKIDKVSGN
ncbi:uncharacterized protein LOC102800891 [Saccoglossus kowalevskii]|uniref:Uncharacterized protein LOC102800891 n=1 Tax=Saccoglossus kowalevskii TaxID=10224 RepID=A0ABM0MMM3_SACKO|nr:PREDICTED: uncharacterized protein LOC102800891 [Saccoglossus kowalevskii]